jgi:hypothetical protein
MWWTLAGDVVVATNNSKVASEGGDDIFLLYDVTHVFSRSTCSEAIVLTHRSHLPPIVSPSVG